MSNPLLFCLANIHTTPSQRRLHGNARASALLNESDHWRSACICGRWISFDRKLAPRSGVKNAFKRKGSASSRDADADGVLRRGHFHDAPWRSNRSWEPHAGNHRRTQVDEEACPWITLHSSTTSRDSLLSSPDSPKALRSKGAQRNGRMSLTHLCANASRLKHSPLSSWMPTGGSQSSPQGGGPMTSTHAAVKSTPRSGAPGRRQSFQHYGGTQLTPCTKSFK